MRFIRTYQGKVLMVSAAEGMDEVVLMSAGKLWFEVLFVVGAIGCAGGWEFGVLLRSLWERNGFWKHTVCVFSEMWQVVQIRWYDSFAIAT